MRSPSAWGPVGGGGGRSLGMIGSYMFSSEPRGENSGHSSYFSPVDPEDVDSPERKQIYFEIQLKMFYILHARFIFQQVCVYLIIYKLIFFS